MVPIHVCGVAINLKNARALRSSTDDEKHWNFEGNEEGLETVTFELRNWTEIFYEIYKIWRAEKDRNELQKRYFNPGDLTEILIWRLTFDITKTNSRSFQTFVWIFFDRAARSSRQNKKNQWMKSEPLHLSTFLTFFSPGTCSHTLFWKSSFQTLAMNWTTQQSVTSLSVASILQFTWKILHGT